jgi:hypothetical protein
MPAISARRNKESIMSASTYQISTAGHAVNPLTERQLADNGMAGDKRVTLCAAESADQDDAETLYYMRTNGNPVMLSDDIRDAWDFVASSGLPVTQLARAIHADASAYAESRAWALDQLTAVQGLQDVLDANPYEVEQTHYGHRARFLDEADEERGGWLAKGHPCESDALYELARYGVRR